MGWLKLVGGLMSAVVKLAMGAAIYLAGSRGAKLKASEQALKDAREARGIEAGNRRLSDADALDRLHGRDD